MFVEIQALQSLCYMFIYIRQKIKLLVSCILYLVHVVIKTRTRNLPKKNSLRKHHLQSFSEWFPKTFEVPLTFYCKIDEIPDLPAVASPQKLQEKNPESLKYDAL